MAKNNDRLGGYALRDLLAAAPVTKSPQQIKKDEKAAKKAAGKRGIVASVLGAPFRLVAGLVKLPVTVAAKLVGGILNAIKEILRLPVRVLAAIVSPWRKQ